MDKAILLAVAASLCTATSSVCQRMGAKSNQITGFDAGLVGRLARQPIWRLMEAFMAYHKAVCDAGVMVDSNVLDTFETATSVQVNRAGERVITDGPFAETREYLGGYYILDLPDLDTAIDWAARCPGARAWRVEVRPIREFGLS